MIPQRLECFLCDCVDGFSPTCDRKQLSSPIDILKRSGVVFVSLYSLQYSEINKATFVGRQTVNLGS